MSTFTINSHKITYWQLTLATLLIGLHVAMLCAYFWINDPDQFDFIALLDMDAERNLPTLFSVANLLFAALLSRLSGAQDTPNQGYWKLLALVMLFMAVDEAISLHEELFGPWTDAFLEARGTYATGYLYYAWVIPYGLLTLIIGLSFLRFLARLPKRVALGLIISGSLFVSGALGLEMLEGMEVFTANDANSLYYRILSTIEESLEILAIILFNHVLLQRLAEDRACWIFTTGKGARDLPHPPHP